MFACLCAVYAACAPSFRRVQCHHSVVELLATARHNVPQPMLKPTNASRVHLGIVLSPTTSRMTTAVPFVKVKLWRRGHQPRNKEQAPAVQRQPLALRVTLVGCKTHEPNWELTRREEKSFRRTNTRSLPLLGDTAQQDKQDGMLPPGTQRLSGFLSHLVIVNAACCIRSDCFFSRASCRSSLLLS